MAKQINIEKTNDDNQTTGDKTMTYKIAVVPDYYRPDTRNAVRISDYDYETIDAAQEYIDDLEDDIYVTSHGEAGRPAYLILSDSDAEWISSGRNGDGSNYDWNGCECEHANNAPADYNPGPDDEPYCCGECRSCIGHMIDADRFYVECNAVVANG